jgi:Ca-activated chloride channel family protein
MISKLSYPALIAAFLTVPSVQACEVALALTVDISGSVDKEEFRLQMDGLAGALRDPTVAEALVSKKASVMLVQWTGTSRQKRSISWRSMADYEAVETMAEAVEKAPRAWRNFSTAIGDALTFTSAFFDEVSECKRKVIDVSGDGYSNEGTTPIQIRSHLQQEGFTINGLAIEGSAEDLTGYYRDNVIAGNGSFVMTANTFEEYPIRIKQKLFREVTNQLAALGVPLKRF